MNTADPCINANNWNDIATELRDFATSLCGDPLEGEIVMRRVLKEFRRDVKQSIGVDISRDWLMKDVEAICLLRSGCPLSADPEYVDPSDDDETHDSDLDDDDSDLDGTFADGGVVERNDGTSAEDDVVERDDDEDTDPDWNVERILRVVAA